jgi:hypothetical protein
MSHLHVAGALALLTRPTAERRASRALAQELAGYATPAQRDDLHALLEQSGSTDDQVAGILSSQAQAELLQVG